MKILNHFVPSRLWFALGIFDYGYGSIARLLLCHDNLREAFLWTKTFNVWISTTKRSLLVPTSFNWWYLSNGKDFYFCLWQILCQLLIHNSEPIFCRDISHSGAWGRSWFHIGNITYRNNIGTIHFTSWTSSPTGVWCGSTRRRPIFPGNSNWYFHKLRLLYSWNFYFYGKLFLLYNHLLIHAIGEKQLYLLIFF